jgi:hypothetical protein
MNKYDYSKQKGEPNHYTTYQFYALNCSVFNQNVCE